MKISSQKNNHLIRHAPWLTAALVTTLLLPGCGTAPSKSKLAGKSVTELNAQIIEAETKGNLVVAAQAYEQLAKRAVSPQKEEHLLRAADILLRAQHLAKAKALLSQLPETLPASQALQRRFLLSRVALRENTPTNVLAYLPLKELTDIPDDQLPTWHGLRAEAYNASGKHLEATREYVFLEPKLTDRERIADNHQRIWQSLMKLSESQMKAAEVSPPDTLSGWVELAIMATSLQDQPSQLRIAANKWKRLYPSHPAQDEFLDNLLGLKIEGPRPRPNQIALLLPLTGKFSGQATAIRDGFLAAFYAREDKRYTPRIRIYDTQGETELGLKLYQQAIDEGATFIVGPLTKQVVDALAEAGPIDVPTLVLNYSSREEQGSENLFQYGLLPEDEARQVAERAWLDGHTRGVVLTPEGEWGDRMEITFKEYWKQLDGVLLSSRRYDSKKNDYAQPIKELLGVDQSHARFNALKKLLNRKMEFKPRRRQDVDFIYVAAFPRQARVIRPQLKFYYAADVPVYGTSHLYAGKRDRTHDKDMNGIVFCDMPWMFTGGKGQGAEWRDIVKQWPAATPMKRLYAMGVDAYSLTSEVPYMQRYRQEHYNGMSGTLYIDEKNRVHRQLLWAKFVGGIAKLTDAPPLR